jgi:beta-lactam-binding protein with PASTA domain
MNTGKTIFVSIITAAITSAAVTVLLVYFATGRPFPGTDVEVPSVVGLRTDQARMLLEGRSLFLLISSQREDPKVEAGHIIQQNPMEGSRVKKGANVQVDLSVGFSKVQVPGIVGLTLDEAVRVLTTASLKQGTVTRQASDSVPADHVMTSLPLAGETASRGAAVDMVVSSGKELSLVPDLVGKNLKVAKEELTKDGFQLGKVSTTYDENRRGGLVLKQEPAARAMAEKGAAVDLIVNESD